MSDKKLLLAKILGRTRILHALRGLTGPTLIVLNYHRVRKAGPPAETAFEEGVYGPSAPEFERQMEWISRNTELLTEDEVIERVDTGRPFGTPSSLVTFDDGYVDNYETAFPVLRKYSIPAIFFIPTRLISSRELGWWDVLAYLIKNSARSSISIDAEEIPLADRKLAISRLIGKLKQQRAAPRLLTMESLSEACGVPMPGIELQGRELMTWEQLREVSRSGISIGSHTHSHPVLSQLDRESQREELRVSKEILEREIGTRVRSIAYPFGGSLHYGTDSMSLASECGYEIGFSFQGRANRGDRIDRFRISRLRAADELELMAASVLLPGIFA